ncbi:DUF6055 domain-containing protein [Flavobacterium hydrophilum]|uniref:DUF2268 domain-containing protein n=1 Tax=Flavobacterium hydrophilum TaxID=2211445 RepID=A0A2V4C1P4_9FLAO|nr:DUF6055 domain-containing protein [Flavobacterium hydrophilum]PXY45229.1 hypothetical protein DMB68_11085 [Flavobacterium hydrophilum]
MKKKKFLVLILGIIAVFFFSKMIRNFTVEQEIQTLKSEHFVISYGGIYKSDAEKISQNLEHNYSKIRTNLKDVKHEPVKVFVYGSHQKFSLATGLIGNVNGTSRGPNEFHFVWTNWFNSVFPDDPLKTAVHEFTHCVQLNILIEKAKETIITQDRLNFDKEFDKKFAAEYPRWFWESISIFEAGEVNSLSVKYAKSKNLTLEELNHSNQIYNIGYTIIEYITQKWGKDMLPKLIASFGNIEKTLNISTQEFEKGWIAFLNEKY